MKINFLSISFIISFFCLCTAPQDKKLKNALIKVIRENSESEGLAIERLDIDSVRYNVISLKRYYFIKDSLFKRYSVDAIVAQNASQNNYAEVTAYEDENSRNMVVMRFLDSLYVNADTNSHVFKVDFTMKMRINNIIV